MDRLQPVLTKGDISPEYQQSPIGLLLEYHNLDRPFEYYDKAALLIGMCMDNRLYMIREH